MEHIDNKSEIVNPRISPREPKVSWDMPFEDYRAHKDHISSTGLKTLLTESPEKFLYSWHEGKSDTDALRFGRIFHMAALEPDRFRSEYIVEPVFEGYTKQGKLSTRSTDALEKRDKWRAENKGKTFVTLDELDQITGMLNQLMKNELVKNIIGTGKPEASLFGNDPVTGLLVKIRPDILCTEELIIADVKTCVSSHPTEFSKAVAKYRYDIQLSLYKLMVQVVLGIEIKSACWIAIEKTPPYACEVIEADLDDLALSDQWVRHGLNLLKDCVEKNQWPGYSGQQIVRLQYPKWMQNEPLPMFEFR